MCCGSAMAMLQRHRTLFGLTRERMRLVNPRL